MFLLLIQAAAFAGTSESFDQIKTLVGKWEGTATWSGARTGEQKMDAEYSLTGRGSAVVENLMIDGETFMTSVYHKDGDSLRMTHFCGAGNQPRLIASSSQDDRTLSFKLADITNLAAPDAPHVTALDLAIQSPDALELTFTFVAKGQTSTELIKLHRSH